MTRMFSREIYDWKFNRVPIMQSSENNLITCLCSSYWCASLCNRHLLCYRTDFEAGVRDFKERLAYYEKVYNYWIYRENSSHVITDFLHPSYPIAKLLIHCMPSVCKTPRLRAILDRSMYDRLLYSCHSSSIPCLLSSLPEFIYDPDMLLFLSKIQNTCTNPTQLLIPVASISSYFEAPAELGPRCPVQLTQETSADGMQREIRGVWLDLEDKGILVI